MLIISDRFPSVTEPIVRLITIIFIVGMLAKGPAIFNGYAFDDYTLITGVTPKLIETLLNQGRYIAAAIFWMVDSIGVSLIDLHFSLGVISIFLQAVFIVSLMRFAGVEHLPAASLVGGIMIAHPYLTEIFSFRMSLLGYSFALIFSIITLEMVIKRVATWQTRSVAMLATLAMLFTAQIFLNYFAIAIIFAFIYGQIERSQNGQLSTSVSVYRERAVTLAIISVIGTISYLAITSIVTTSGLTEGTSRSKLITLDNLAVRLEQISSFLVRIYLGDEPIFLGWLKMLVALMIVVSSAIIVLSLLTKRVKTNPIRDVALTLIALFMLIPASIGIIAPFQDWWPVPRVVGHVAIIIGFIFLMADHCIYESSNRFIRNAIFIIRAVILVGFVFLSNQILADQQRINQWDKMMANRIISRLEAYPNFSNIHSVYVNGGFWGFPAKLRTVQGDMNVSAFLPDYSKVPLLSEVSGYWLERAVGSKAAAGESYCKDKQPWPHVESITVENDLAIICLKKL